MSHSALGDPASRQNRLALRLLAGALVAVVGLFAASRTSGMRGAGQAFDYAHWTLAYAVATALAWMGVRGARGRDASPRRWFASGLTITLVAQLVFDIQEITHHTAVANLSDALYLSIGPCFVMGLLAQMRGRTPAERRSFDLNVTSLALVVLTLTADLYLPRRGRTDPLDLTVLIIYPSG
jgi:hypothetical protein